MSRTFRPLRTLPPLADRLAEGRPVLTKAAATDLTQRLLALTSADTVQVRITHTANIVTRLANGEVLSTNDGDTLIVDVQTSFGARGSVKVQINQYDDTALRGIVRTCESLARGAFGSDEGVQPRMQRVPDTLVPVNLWHDTTVRAMTTTRGTVIPELLTRASRAWLTAAGFLGFMARAKACLSKDGFSVFHEETDSEVTMTARNADGTRSGWDGRAARDWSTVNVATVADKAIDMATRGVAPVALEPGRRTAILSPTALIQIMRFLAWEFDAQHVHYGSSAFTIPPHGNRLGQRVFDPRLNMRSDPNDPDGGYCPWIRDGYGTPVMSWVEQGILKNLAYVPGVAEAYGKAYSDIPTSIRISGGTTTIDEMIARCEEGVYVNRLSNVEMIDPKTGLMTGTTRDGCFYIKHGKIDRAIKNFRFLDSPFFFLNAIDALGVPERAAFGYTPAAPDFESPDAVEWPRPPIIVPPMMVRDFNFSALVDAI